MPKQHLLINQSLGSYRGGSLPNVNHIGSNSVDLKVGVNGVLLFACCLPILGVACSLP